MQIARYLGTCIDIVLADKTEVESPKAVVDPVLHEKIKSMLIKEDLDGIIKKFIKSNDREVYKLSINSALNELHEEKIPPFDEERNVEIAQINIDKEIRYSLRMEAVDEAVDKFKKYVMEKCGINIKDASDLLSEYFRRSRIELDVENKVYIIKEGYDDKNAMLKTINPAAFITEYEFYSPKATVTYDYSISEDRGGYSAKVQKIKRDSHEYESVASRRVEQDVIDECKRHYQRAVETAKKFKRPPPNLAKSNIFR